MSRADRAARRLPQEGGLYVLVLRWAGRPCGLRVGGLGRVEFRRGFYAYVGSARAGLRARMHRHLRVCKPKHWHIDYLRPRTRPAAAMVVPGAHDECRLNRRVAAASEATVPGFGCSDCTCAGHLHYFPCDPAAALAELGEGWVVRF